LKNFRKKLLKILSEALMIVGGDGVQLTGEGAMSTLYKEGII